MRQQSETHRGQCFSRAGLASGFQNRPFGLQGSKNLWLSPAHRLFSAKGTSVPAPNVWPAKLSSLRSVTRAVRAGGAEWRPREPDDRDEPNVGPAPEPEQVVRREHVRLLHDRLLQ